MPEQLAPPEVTPVDLESEPFVLRDQEFSDDYALETVKRTFWEAEWFRQQNHDTRWNGHDASYFGFVPPKVWEGTTTPRASLGQQAITFGQIEAALPSIAQAVFSEDDWFQVLPEPGSTPEEARQIKEHLLYNLEHGVDDKPVEIELEHALRQLLLNGNGGVFIEYDGELKRPVVEWVDLRDIYVDPACPSSYIDDGRHLIRRRMMTVDEVVSLGADKRMRIPPKPILAYMCSSPSAVFGDRTKQTSEALRGVQYNPSQHEWTPLPSDRKIEVLIYYSKNRIIWTLNRQWVAYNEKNPYGFIPAAFAPCFSVLGRFYAQSFADVLEDNQKYVEALMNAHLDELALNLHPPRVKKRGGLLTPSQQRWRPGQVQEADNPKDDVVVQWPQQSTADVMSDIAYLEASSEKLTGVNAVGMGVPRAGNVNRTATGVNSQLQGGANRLWTIVRHVEDYLICPMLYKMYKMIQYHTIPGQLLPALGQNDQLVQVGADAFQKPCRFRMLASSKMMTREKLAQIFPFLSQYFLNGAFLEQLKGAGKTVDFDEFTQMLQDATGTGQAYHLIRPMNDQEKQSAQTPPPQVQMQQQLAQMDGQTRTQLMQMKIQGELQKTQMQKQVDPQQAAQEQQAEQQKAEMDLAAQKQKMVMEQQKAHQKLIMDHLTNQQKLHHEARTAQQKMVLDAIMGQHQIQQSREQHAMDMAQQAQQAQQDSAIDQDAHAQNMSAQKEQGEHKMGLEKQKLKMDHERGKMDPKAKVTIAKETAKAKAANRPKPAPKK